MRILVTGGSGFIGAAVTEAAEIAGHQVESFDRRDGRDIMGDLSGFEWADSIIHLAGVLGTAELFDTPHEAVDINVHGTLNVLEACERYGLGYVGITMPPVFPSVYTATKIAADRLATAWHIAKGVPTAHVRAFNAFGPGQAHGPGHPQKIVPTFAAYSWRREPIPVWGDGKQTVDLVHSRDLGRLLVEATQHGDDVTFDGGTGHALTVNDVAHFVNAYTGSTAGIEYLPMRAGEVPTFIVAKGDGWDRLDWKPEFTVPMLDDTVESYRP